MLGSRQFESHGFALGFGVVGSIPGQRALHFLGHRARGYTERAGFLLFSSKAIDGPVPSGRGEWTDQQFGRLGALSARAMYPAAASQMSTLAV